MNGTATFFGDPWALAPYGILVAGALFVLAASFGRTEKESRGARSIVAFLSLAGAVATLLAVPSVAPHAGFFLTHDVLGVGFALPFLLLLALIVPVLPLGKSSLAGPPSGILSLLLLSACGGLWMIFADHLLFFFLGLELFSIPLYVLCGLASDRKKGSEAAFKYLILGAVASAFFVMGMAFYWGGSGTLLLSSTGVVGPSGSLVTFGAALMFIGVAFKLGLAPFHMWVPDVYEGAPSVLVSWMAGGVKGAAIVIAIRLFGGASFFREGLWSALLSGVAVLSMVWGSFGALAQSNLKRMLGYSAIAHAGYMLIGVVTVLDGSMAGSGVALAYYVLAYGSASLLSFLVFSIEEEEGRVGIADLKGLSVRKPFLAFSLAVSLLSLAGIPPLGGFIGKFNVFALAVENGHFGLILVAVVTSVVSLAYYLRLIVSAYMERPERSAPLPLTPAMASVLGIAVAVTLLTGLLPGPILAFLSGGP
jgi:NADH-quinone oxidoreductase subunit N